MPSCSVRMMPHGRMATVCLNYSRPLRADSTLAATATYAHVTVLLLLLLLLLRAGVC
jgi:hypothetical protein